MKVVRNVDDEGFIAYFTAEEAANLLPLLPKGGKEKVNAAEQPGKVLRLALELMGVRAPSGKGRKG
jgi:hypothetical protein